MDVGARHADLAVGRDCISALRPHFHLSRKDAAERMNICISSLKRASAACGIKVWPHRKLALLRKVQAALQDRRLADPAGELQKAVLHNIAAIEKDPNTELAPQITRASVRLYKHTFAAKQKGRGRRDADTCMVAGAFGTLGAQAQLPPVSGAFEAHAHTAAGGGAGMHGDAPIGDDGDDDHDHDDCESENPDEPDPAFARMLDMAVRVWEGGAPGSGL